MLLTTHVRLDSIPQYVKPFQFVLKPLDELLDIRMSSLFPVGGEDFGCGDNNNNNNTDDLQYDNETGQYYRIVAADRTIANQSQRFDKRLVCKYKTADQFVESLREKKSSLIRAITVYLTQGPTPTNSFRVKAGKPGCELETLDYVGGNSSKTHPTYKDMMSKTSKVQFDTVMDIGKLIGKNQAFDLKYKGKKWYSLHPGSDRITESSGCLLKYSDGLTNPVCVNGVLLSYQQNGYLVMNQRDFKINAANMGGYLHSYFNKPQPVMVAQVDYVSALEEMAVAEGRRMPKLPCNVKWSNSYSLDISKDHNCLNFNAASAGDIFVLFAGIPTDYTTWYYAQINLEGVAFYQGLKLTYARPGPSIGSLGDGSLYENFFMCLYHTKGGDVILQYGKTEPQFEYGQVLASHLFDTGGVRPLVKFYSFGSGEKEVNFIDVRLIQEKKDKIICDSHWVLIDGVCLRDCHSECKERGKCRKHRDATACADCKHFVAPRGPKKKECVRVCPPGFTVAKSGKKECTPCEKGTYKAEKGDSPCLPCGAGHFSDEKGATKCKPCPKGIGEK